MRTPRSAAIAVLLSAAITGGCSGTAWQVRERVVFHVQTNIHLGQRGNVGEIIEVACHHFSSQPSIDEQMTQQGAALWVMSVTGGW